MAQRRPEETDDESHCVFDPLFEEMAAAPFLKPIAVLLTGSAYDDQPSDATLLKRCVDAFGVVAFADLDVVFDSAEARTIQDAYLAATKVKLCDAFHVFDPLGAWPCCAHGEELSFEIAVVMLEPSRGLNLKYP